MSRLKVDVIAGGSLLRAGTEVPDGVNVASQYIEDGAPAEPNPPSDIPPKGGPGSGVEAWAAYAAGKVEVPEDAKRDDIVAALDAAGFPTD